MTDSCAQHPHAQTIGGMCGGCTQIPAAPAACAHPDGYDGECPCPPDCGCCKVELAPAPAEGNDQRPCTGFVPDEPRAPGLCAHCGDSKAWHRNSEQHRAERTDVDALARLIYEAECDAWGLPADKWPIHPEHIHEAYRTRARYLLDRLHITPRTGPAPADDELTAVHQSLAEERDHAVRAEAALEAVRAWRRAQAQHAAPRYDHLDAILDRHDVTRIEQQLAAPEPATLAAAVEGHHAVMSERRRVFADLTRVWDTVEARAIRHIASHMPRSSESGAQQ
ncbi:hypothetical protein [Streptomyces pini]|uniref:Uncharacterized protein n=1 Tax=Streptomyces pini TaxID=1520580 RepID=A0A1I4C0T1_9ACTN|nr:hypothetical protein [Streptomyces pini]SFK74373.1 hypothetical protein SAMN05192584_108204 [Streptomyces pini]